MSSLVEVDDDRIPAKTDVLLRELNRMFPHRCPSLGENNEAVQRYAGKRELIDSLMVRTYGPDRENWPR